MRLTIAPLGLHPQRFHEFQAYPKTPRLFREAVITEKIDGTNGAIVITDDGDVYAQSRSRVVTPGKGTDNHGFAGWVAEREELLRELLGPGRHFGEFWGQSIARNYGLQEKRFSLFNVDRWKDTPLGLVGGLGTVPVLWRGTFHSDYVRYAINTLVEEGSIAAPGFMRPEGVITFHTASRQVYKTLIENDELPKGVK